MFESDVEEASEQALSSSTRNRKKEAKRDSGTSKKPKSKYVYVVYSVLHKAHSYSDASESIPNNQRSTVMQKAWG